MFNCVKRTNEMPSYMQPGSHVTCKLGNREAKYFGQALLNLLKNQLTLKKNGLVQTKHDCLL